MADQFPRLSGPARGARVDFTRLFEASPARCLVLTPDLEITAVTDSYLAATMTRREEIAGRRLFDVFPDNPADPAATGVANLRRSLETVLATGRAHTMAIQKYDIRRPESEGGEFEERYWSPVNSPVLGPDGRVALIIHTVEDVTERIKRERADAEHARKADEFRTQVDRMESEIDLRSRELGRVNASLRDSEDHLRLALAAGRIGTWRWDLRNDTVLLSERAWEVLGSPPDRTDAAATYRDAVHPDDRERVMATVARSIETGAVYDQEYRCVLHDGSVRWVAARGHVFRDEHGRPSVMQGVVLDITERNAAEALRGQKLEHERAAAEEASRAKSMFLAHMSHELRTPLNGVIGMIELLLGGNLGGRERRYAEITRASAQSLTSIINDILDFSKIEAGHLELIEVEFDVHTLLDDVVQMMALPARQKGLELACHCDADVPRVVRGDPDRLRQIVVNLVNNAIKFTASGSVVMRAVLDRREGEGVMVRVSVTDTGIGIPADRLDRLFKAFSQADSFTTRTYGGTGLGLAISKRLAELMGGGIGVESERGKGSTFWFTVMLRAPEEAGRGAVRSVDARGLRVLAVDASEVHREILESQLASSGFEASSVTDGHAALRALSECADWLPRTTR